MQDGSGPEILVSESDNVLCDDLLTEDRIEHDRTAFDVGLAHWCSVREAAEPELKERAENRISAQEDFVSQEDFAAEEEFAAQEEFAARSDSIEDSVVEGAAAKDTTNGSHQQLSDLWMADIELRAAKRETTRQLEPTLVNELMSRQINSPKDQTQLTESAGLADGWGSFCSMLRPEQQPGGRKTLNLDFGLPLSMSVREEISLTGHTIGCTLRAHRYALRFGSYRVATDRNSYYLKTIEEIVRSTDSAEHLSAAAGSNDRCVRTAAAANSYLPVPLMWELAFDPEPSVRLALARNKHTPVEILSILAEDTSKDVANTACSLLARLFGQTFVEVKYRH